jgi:hypothetical protein
MKTTLEKKTLDKEASDRISYMLIEEIGLSTSTAGIKTEKITRIK